jgi:8-oxo-dGTP diphosphatase
MRKSERKRKPPMNATDQGTSMGAQQRYQVIPRTLILLTSSHPQTGAQEVLLLKGAPTKRLWANKYNGLGGHIEAHEDIYAAALREVNEETGLVLQQLTLRGIVNINTGRDDTGPRPGVLMFVFHGASQSRPVQTTPEGTPVWIPVADVAQYPLVDDLYEVLPRTLTTGPLFFGHYSPQPDGTLVYHFHG